MVEIQKVEQAVLDAIRKNGGSVTLVALDRNPDVVRHLGYGVDAIDVVLTMTVRGLVSYNLDGEEVKAL